MTATDNSAELAHYVGCDAMCHIEGIECCRALNSCPFKQVKVVILGQGAPPRKFNNDLNTIGQLPCPFEVGWAYHAPSMVGVSTARAVAFRRSIPQRWAGYGAILFGPSRNCGAFVPSQHLERAEHRLRLCSACPRRSVAGTADSQ